MQSNLPLKLWGYSILHAIFVINKLLSKVTSKISLYELLHHKTPNYAGFRSFGCLCYLTIITKPHKFSPKALKCIYLGSLATQKGHILYSLRSHSIIVSRDVIFYEGQFLLVKDSAPSLYKPLVDHATSFDDSSDNLPDIEATTIHAIDVLNGLDMDPNSPQEDAPPCDITPNTNTAQDVMSHQNHIIDFDGNVIPLPNKRPTRKPLVMNDYFRSFATSFGQSKGTSYPM